MMMDQSHEKGCIAEVFGRTWSPAILAAPTHEELYKHHCKSRKLTGEAGPVEVSSEEKIA